MAKLRKGVIPTAKHYTNSFILDILYIYLILCTPHNYDIITLCENVRVPCVCVRVYNIKRDYFLPYSRMVRHTVCTLWELMVNIYYSTMGCAVKEATQRCRCYGLVTYIFSHSPPDALILYFYIHIYTITHSFFSFHSPKTCFI